jgi:hypothetical protein
MHNHISEIRYSNLSDFPMRDKQGDLDHRRVQAVSHERGNKGLCPQHPLVIKTNEATTTIVLNII